MFNRRNSSELHNRQHQNTLHAMAWIFQSLDNLLHPGESADREEGDIDQKFIDEAVKIFYGQHELSELLSQAITFTDETPATYPFMKDSDAHTMQIIMIQAVIRVFGNHFNDMSQPHELIMKNILRSLLLNGTVEKWLHYIQEMILDSSLDFQQKNAALDLVSAAISLFTMMLSGAAPFDKYVDHEKLDLTREASEFVEKNSQDNSKRMRKLKRLVRESWGEIRDSRIQAFHESLNWLYSIVKILMPEIKDLTSMEAASEFFKRENKSQKIKDFQKFLRNFFSGKLPENFLHHFNEALASNQYNKYLYYALFDTNYGDESIKTLANKIWRISIIDTLNKKPQEATRRMPSTGSSGLKTTNYSYDYDNSTEYQQWLKQPLCRVCADIIMDSFHVLVDIFAECKPDEFIVRFLKYIDIGAKSQEQIEHLKIDGNEDSELKLPVMHYEKTFCAFADYILEKIYKMKAPKYELDGVYKRLVQIKAQDPGFIIIITETLTSLITFANDLKTLRSPDSKKLNSFVFGIGFNGSKFGCYGHHLQDKHEIFTHFSTSRRNPGGDLFLAILGSFSQIGSKIVTSKVELHDLESNFDKYRGLIILQLSNLVKGHHRQLSAATPYFTEARDYYLKEIELVEGFLSQLEQPITFNQFSYELKKWIRNIVNWYSIPKKIPVRGNDPISENEEQVQDMVRKLIFDIFSGRNFLAYHDDVIDLLFLHWKQRLIDAFVDDDETSQEIRNANKLSAVANGIDKIKQKIAEFVMQTDEALKHFWTNNINSQFEEFKQKENKKIGKERITTENQIEKTTKTLKSLREAACLNGEEASTHNLQNKINDFEMKLAKEQDDLARNHLIPERIDQLSDQQYLAFRKYFFEKRDPGQCAEPGLAKVLGYEYFFPVFVGSGSGGKYPVTDQSGQPIIIGNYRGDSLTPPCSNRCHFHVTGHLYLGETFAYNSLDRLDSKRHIHNLGGVDSRLLTPEELALSSCGMTHFQTVDENSSTTAPGNNRQQNVSAYDIK